MSVLEIRIGDKVYMRFPKDWVRRELTGFKGAQKWMKFYPILQQSLKVDDQSQKKDAPPSECSTLAPKGL